MNKKLVVLLTVVSLTMLAIPAIVSAQQWQNHRNGQGMQQQGKMQQRGRSQSQQFFGGNNWMANLPSAGDGDLSQEVVDVMTAGIMDEYNAYNVYQVVIDQFGEVRPFVNIQQSEAQHIATWEFLFERYNLDVPEAPAVPIDLTFNSVSSACTVAADAEIANFGLYDEMLETVAEYPDMVQVITRLRNASEINHLPAFENCAR